MNDIFKKRKSIYPDQFNEKPIDRETIKKLLEVANYAPSHKKTEPWRFKVFEGGSKDGLGLFLSEIYEKVTPVEKFSKFKQGKIQHKTTASAAVIAICMQRDPKERVPEWEEIAATAMAVQNLWLKATELNLGGYWSSPSYISEMDEFLNLENGEKCLGFFFLGNYEIQEDVERKRTDFESKVVWI